jgi:hypothetical protein
VEVVHDLGRIIILQVRPHVLPTKHQVNVAVGEQVGMGGDGLTLLEVIESIDRQEVLIQSLLLPLHSLSVLSFKEFVGLALHLELLIVEVLE